ncbi:MAG TPA: hypothetical protein VIR33_04910 [Thermopolyspora sp.]
MTEPTKEPAATTEPTTATGPELGDAGKQALDRMKADRDAAKAELKELRDQIKTLQERDPVKAIAEALGMNPTEAKGDDLAATVKQMQQQMRDAELKASRLEVAAAKGLTPAQAARLQGSTREELEADADQLRALFPAAPALAGTPGVPAPDPSQGSRGGGPDREALIKEAQAKGDWRTVISLQNEKLAGAKPA